MRRVLTCLLLLMLIIGITKALRLFPAFLRSHKSSRCFISLFPFLAKGKHRFLIFAENSTYRIVKRLFRPWKTSDIAF